MSEWKTVCHIKDLVPQTGVCAKVGAQQVAIFYCSRTSSIYATSNYDPVGQANVISRGIMGSTQGEPIVASPLYKEAYSLRTGICLDNDKLKLDTFPIRIEKSLVQVQAH
ncbi:nitrite reductase small subunit NirD [Vibrio sp. ZSDZ34]|jgi:nitrite reductase (NADH) small subunit|uniref:Nitrite reductase small subunit NirD n=1 Tax=Vibrio gelatinilyticus TaxID=2893468 RepID=A0A9X1WI70_9VIBR|nr:nitrite reductase small subunit NirD [Vibrio gelatinilyticus]MCJ2377099.1 nitrite reductase small subunit NirD [Vibrio gelatinilyticus]